MWLSSSTLTNNCVRRKVNNGIKQSFQVIELPTTKLFATSRLGPLTGKAMANLKYLILTPTSALMSSTHSQSSTTTELNQEFRISILKAREIWVVPFSAFNLTYIILSLNLKLRYSTHFKIDALDGFYSWNMSLCEFFMLPFKLVSTGESTSVCR